jgi:hypothetical protein
MPRKAAPQYQMEALDILDLKDITPMSLFDAKDRAKFKRLLSKVDSTGSWDPMKKDSLGLAKKYLGLEINMVIRLSRWQRSEVTTQVLQVSNVLLMSTFRDEGEWCIFGWAARADGSIGWKERSWNLTRGLIQRRRLDGSWQDLLPTEVPNAL